MNRWTTHIRWLVILLPAIQVCNAKPTPETPNDTVYVATAATSTTPPPYVVPKHVVFFTTPREMFDVFRTVMDEVDYGNDRDIDKAYAAIEMPRNLPTPELENYRYHAARKLQIILNNLQYVSQDIPTTVAGDNAVVTLGHGNNSASFQLHRDKNGGWRFSAQTLENPELEKLYLAIEERNQKFTRADLEGDTYVNNLRSPSQSMRTFMNGMYGRNGMTINDAIEAMDLSEIDKNVRQTVGRTRAVQLVRILNRTRKINLTALSSDPEYPHAHVFLRVPAIGRVVMIVVEDPNTGLKAWKFSPKTIATIPAMYAIYRDKPLAPGVEPVDQYLPFDILASDYVHRHQPSLDKLVGGLPIWKWIGASVVVLIAVLGWIVIRRLLRLAMRHVIARNETIGRRKIEYAFILPVQLAFFVWFCYSGFDLLCMPAAFLAIMEFSRDISLTIVAAWLACLAVDAVIHRLEKRRSPRSGMGENLLLPLISRLIKIIIVIFALFRVAEECGQDSTRVLAALGIGGVALALASKDTVENVFGSIMILLERPFRLDDWIITKDIEGRVEHVGMRSTRVRTFYNSLITVPNSQFITSPVDNMGRRQYRRLKVMISVTYDTPPEKIVAFTEGIQELVRTHPKTRKDFYHVRLHDLAAASLNILLYVFFVTNDYGEEIEAREQLFLDILRLAKKLKVEFAFPTQTLYMRQEDTPQHEQPETVQQACREGVDSAKDVLAHRELRPHHEMTGSQIESISNTAETESLVGAANGPQSNDGT